MSEKYQKIYTYAGKYNDQQQYKAIIEAVMFSTPEIFNDNSLISPGTSVTFRYSSAIKSLHLFTEVLDVKNKNDVCRTQFNQSIQYVVVKYSKYKMK